MPIAIEDTLLFNCERGLTEGVARMQERGSDRAGQAGQQKDQQDGSFWTQLSTLGTDLFGSGSLSPPQQPQQPSDSPVPANDAGPETASLPICQKGTPTIPATPVPDLLSEDTALTSGLQVALC